MGTALTASAATHLTRPSLIWEISPDLLGTVNAEGFFESANPAWMTVLGLTEVEVTSVSLFSLIHPDDIEVDPISRTLSN